MANINGIYNQGENFNCKELWVSASKNCHHREKRGRLRVAQLLQPDGFYFECEIWEGE